MPFVTVKRKTPCGEEYEEEIWVADPEEEPIPVEMPIPVEIPEYAEVLR